MNMPIATRKADRPIDEEILAVMNFMKDSGGKKKVETQVSLVEELVALPEGFESSRYAEVLAANVEQISRLIDYATKHGGLKRLQKDVQTVRKLASLTGGNLNKAKQAIDFLNKVKG